jgi:lathosterol oxidase
LVLLAIVVGGERLLEPDRAAKNHRLAWAVQALFIVAGYAAGVLLERYVRVRPSIFDFGAVDPGPVLAAILPGLYFLLIVFVVDILGYWAHRAHHRFAFLWRFHAVHHAQRDLDVLHNINHPVEIAARWFIVALPVGLLPPPDGSSLGVIVAFYAIHNHLLHMKGPLHFGRFNAVVADNRHHFIHHSREPRHFDTNFAAIFPVIDRLFGTYHPPATGALPETGLDGQAEPSTLFGYAVAILPGDPAPEPCAADPIPA